MEMHWVIFIHFRFITFSFHVLFLAKEVWCLGFTFSRTSREKEKKNVEKWVVIVLSYHCYYLYNWKLFQLY